MKYFIDTKYLEGTQDSGWGFRIKPTIDLISVGIVAEDSREYYAISKDFNLKEAWNRYDLKPIPDEFKYNDKSELIIKNTNSYKEYWIRDNVLKPIFENWKSISELHSNYNFTYKNFRNFLSCYGKSNAQIAEEIKLFTHCATKDQLEYKGVSENYHKFQFRFSYVTWEVDKDMAKTKEDALTLIMDETDHAALDEADFYSYYTDYGWIALCWLFGGINRLPAGFPNYCINLKQTLEEKARLVPVSYTLNEGLKSIKMSNDYPKEISFDIALNNANWNKNLYDFLKSLYL